jgi:HK97 family phage major capsid protein
MNITPQGQTGRHEYSLHQLVRAMVDPSSKSGGFEYETSQELARQIGRKPTGVYVPVSALTRALTVGTGGGSTGGKTVATNLLSDRFIDLLRNRSIVINAGATVLAGLEGNIAIPRQTSSATAYWVAESGAPTESQAAFDQVPLSPKTIAAYTDFSRKMILQSSLDISQFVASDLAAAIGLGIDLAAIAGTGLNNQPTGILNTSGVHELTLSGAVPTWANMISMHTLVSDANAASGPQAYAMAPGMVAKLSQTLKIAGVDSGYILEGDRSKPTIGGMPVHVSNQLPAPSASAHSMIFGNWSDLIIGQWGVLDLNVDPYTHATSGGVRIVAMQDVDIAVRHAESFCIVTDAGIV